MIRTNTPSCVSTKRGSCINTTRTAETVEDFVNRVYQRVLYRSADRSGLDFYTEAIKRGDIARSDLEGILKDSDEYKIGIIHLDSGPDVVIASTWGMHCGIATYTSFLVNSLSKLCSVDVFPINERGVPGRIEFDKVLNCQHEYGLFGDRVINSPHNVVTWHTVQPYPNYINADAHIVHLEAGLDWFKGQNVFLIPHGTFKFPNGVEKTSPRSRLGLPKDVPMIFIFGFRTPNKMYDELKMILEGVNKQERILGVFTAAPPGVEDPAWEGYFSHYDSGTCSVMLNKWLSDNAINLYASASDIFLFNYMVEGHSSASGAMHRIIGAGNPVVCNRAAGQFSELNEDRGEALKFDDTEEAIESIVELIRNKALYNKYSAGIQSFAKKTSWPNVSKKYLEVFESVMKR